MPIQLCANGLRVLVPRPELASERMKDHDALVQSPWILDVQELSLVSARSDNPKAELSFVEYLRALYSGNSPDLILVIGAPAAVFIQRSREQLFPGTPMLITAVEQRRIH